MEFGSMYASSDVTIDNNRTRYFKREVNYMNAVMGFGGGSEEAGAHFIVGLSFVNDNITSYMEYPDGGRNIASNQLLNGIYHDSSLRPFFGFRTAGGSANRIGGYIGVYWMPNFPREEGYLQDWDAVKNGFHNSGTSLTGIPRFYGTANAPADEYVTSDISYFLVKAGLSIRLSL